ncbi:hypothetical protein [Vallitalea okinawensis]|uniref:hypothetical protein n=1 Tax=Vallitalea okinawensis TaxID=2078660 RepID=UPI000CFB632E|nr:hypothetical protein [Vallitalea okinawensis]
MAWIRKRNMIILILLLVVCIGYIAFNKEYELTEKDNKEIINMVNQYYGFIVEEDFSKALEFCVLENSEIDVHTRIIALEEIWDNLIEEFEIGHKASEIDRYKNNGETQFVVKVSINLKYKNSLGGATGEFVYVKKVKDEWKIDKIHGLDRYGIYRVNQYQYDRLISFLNPNNN